VPPHRLPTGAAPVLAELSRVIVGQRRLLERLVVCVLAKGHILLEGPPGVGKTLTLTTLAQVVGGDSRRIQFTPDLMPSDIVGTRIYRASNETFTTEPGPIFANFVLADEINRAPAKVQAALLEVMAEGQVTIAGETHQVPDPFMVLATENPIESEGVFPLPAAQRDRFMMRVLVDLPSRSEERTILDRMAGTAPVAVEQMTISELRELQQHVPNVHLPEPVADYAVRLTMATRNPALFGVDNIVDKIAGGASPRSTLALVRAARALAVLHGRDAACCQDVYDVAFDVMNHRIELTYDAIADGLTAPEAVASILRVVPAPVGA
jgi:MoxR-like ATPase